MTELYMLTEHANYAFMMGFVFLRKMVVRWSSMGDGRRICPICLQS